MTLKLSKKAIEELQLLGPTKLAKLVDIVDAWDIFGDKSKAIALCLARFDEDTKEAFLNLYTKVDADVEVSEEASATPADSQECPW